MKLALIIIAFAIAATATAIMLRTDSSQPRTASTRAAPRSQLVANGTGFVIRYGQPVDPAHVQIAALLAEDQVFDRIVAALDRVLVMPGPISIEFAECGAPNAFYDPRRAGIIMCYELVSYFLHVFRPHTESSEALGAAALGATVFAFFHELGHALIHHLEIPVTGREEDAADQVATLILLEAGDDGVGMALSGARWFGLLAKDNAQRTRFWDEHGLDGQRFYNVICMVFGADPENRAALIGEFLPEPRARRCAVEYSKIDAAWQRLLANHLR